MLNNTPPKDSPNNQSTNENLEECLKLRLEEWVALSSIYPECTMGSDGPNDTTTEPSIIQLEVPIEMEERAVEILPQTAESTSQGGVKLALTHLPPLILTLFLPLEYPLRETLTIRHIHSTYGWLSPERLEELRLALTEIWNDDLTSASGTLWRTCEWIRSGSFLGAGQSYQISHPHPPLLSRHLSEYNNSCIDDTFAHTTFYCQICLSSVKGSKCLRLNCRHVFCRTCLSDFWSLCITEGDVERVTCADTSCVKENKIITEDEVRRVVSEAQTQRWKALKRKRALEQDPGLIYCPITVCQGPCPGPSNHRDITNVDDVAMRRQYLTLRTCESCGFSFCILCKRTWHGLAPCSSGIAAKFLEQYMALDDDHPDKLALQRRFGKTLLDKLVAKIQEDMENQKWLDSSTKQCPNCLVAVEKSMGCNHMTCARCNTHFCFLCGLKLPGSNPYQHFSDKGPCEGQLFQMANWEPDEDEIMAIGLLED